MVHAKNYELMSTFVKVMQKKTGLFFSGHDVYSALSLKISNALDDDQQEAQLPQRNSASAAHVYLGWLTDRTMQRTPQNHRGCIIFFNFLTFERSDSRSVGRKRILT